MEIEELKNRFSHHKVSADTALEMSSIRQAALQLAVAIDKRMPDGREKSVALRKLEEFVFWANAGIARNAK